jgi:DNA polymerase elongation subunit (family B)
MSLKRYIIFDIETASLKWESFSHSQQKYLLRGAKTKKEILKKKFEMSLTPMTAQVVCIGLLRMAVGSDGIAFQENKAAFSVDNALNDGESKEIELITGDKCIVANEKTTLETFWKIIGKYSDSTLISFNGRSFDAPFLMLRSGLNHVRPSKNLMQGTKFNYSGHIDLMDELSYYSGGGYGATKRFNFDFYTQAFGIKSPKSEGVDGSMVAKMFHAGKIKEISEYCLRDINATWELFWVWQNYLKF